MTSIGTRQTAAARFALHGGPAYQSASDAILRDELTDEQEVAAQELGRRLLTEKPWWGFDAALREARKQVKRAVAA